MTYVYVSVGLSHRNTFTYSNLTRPRVETKPFNCIILIPCNMKLFHLYMTHTVYNFLIFPICQLNRDDTTTRHSDFQYVNYELFIDIISQYKYYVWFNSDKNTLYESISYISNTKDYTHTHTHKRWKSILFLQQKIEY